MEKFSERQKKIALTLIENPKTTEEISQATGFHIENVEDSVKKMANLGLVEKKEDKYALKETIVSELKKRKEIKEKDHFDLRLHAIVEMQSIEKELLQKQMNNLGKAIEEDEQFTIYNIEKEKIIETETGMFSSFIELEFSVKDFRSLIYFMFFYGPSSIEVVKPTEIRLKADDFQEGLMEIAEMIHKYTEYITSVMKKEELAKFTKKLYE